MLIGSYSYIVVHTLSREPEVDFQGSLRLIVPEDHLQFAGCGIGGDLVPQQPDIGAVHYREQRVTQPENRWPLFLNRFQHVGKDLGTAADLWSIRIDPATAQGFQVRAPAPPRQDQAPAVLPVDQYRVRTVEKCTSRHLQRLLPVNPMRP